MCFFTLVDGRFAAFQGGEPLPSAYVAAGRPSDEMGERLPPTALGGYHRLEARSLQAIVDTAAPAAGAWSQTACAQPLAVEVVTGTKRLLTNTNWSPDAQGSQALRLADAASTSTLENAPCARLLQGFTAYALGPRLVEAYTCPEARRQEVPGVILLEFSHDRWRRRPGPIHQRRLYLDPAADDFRGDDNFWSLSP